ncbi:hypothetical protein AAON49_13665 [Pseudotenacibaculum sp. MALMAid0570]|uniref:hypothetical protein n=1 Tax=Pseudotenacibaculum sp. MALMAid0570 TaxID=3143938 RepID=UPI0032DE2CA5
MIKNFLLIKFDQLRGVKYGKKADIEIDLNETTTKKKILRIVSKMNERYSLHFYDAFYNLLPEQKPWTLGDTGAFAEVKKEKNIYRVRLGNHGGFKNKGQWIKMSESELINSIYESRNYNGGKMRIVSRLARKMWVKKGRDKSLFHFYHDISDINKKMK